MRIKKNIKGLSADQTPNSRINNDTLGVKGLRAAFLLKSWKVNFHKIHSYLLAAKTSYNTRATTLSINIYNMTVERVPYKSISFLKL